MKQVKHYPCPHSLTFLHTPLHKKQLNSVVSRMSKADSTGGGVGYSHKDWPKHFPAIPRNQFQKSGNQSVYEVKETKTARVTKIDAPGSTVSSLIYWIDGKNLHFFTDEPDKPEYNYEGRKYGGTVVFDPVAYEMKKARAKLVNGVLWITVPKITAKAVGC